MKNALQIQAILGLIFQQFTDNVTGAIGHVWGKPQIHTVEILNIIKWNTSLYEIN